MRAIEHEHRLATRERETLSEAEGRMRQREEALRHREETFRRRLNEELDVQMRQARREIDEVVAELKAKAKERDASLTTGGIGAVRADARAAVDAIARRAIDEPHGDRSHGDAHGRPPDSVPGHPARSAVKLYLQRLNEPRQPDDAQFKALVEAPFQAPPKKKERRP